MDATNQSFCDCYFSYLVESLPMVLYPTAQMVLGYLRPSRPAYVDEIAQSFPL